MTGILETAAPVFLQKLFTNAWPVARDAPQWIKQKLETNDPFRKEATDYVRYIAKHYNCMRILGMPDPVSLDDIYINVNLRDGGRALLDQELVESYAQSNDYSATNSEGSRSATSILKDHPRLVILGRPGAGKTTYLKYLAVHTLKRTIPLDCVPIFLSLKDWAQDVINLETALVRQFDVCELTKPKEFVRHLLRNGRCIVLLDGFDEIGLEHRDKAIIQIESLVKDFPKNRYCLSCRTAANTYVFSHFSDAEIADFTQTQVDAFVRKWFAQKSTAEKCVRELHDPEHKGIHNLASNPLLLTLICIAYQEQLSFPESRAELYERALWTLLAKWDASRNVTRYNPYKKLTVRKKELLLSRLAAYTFEKKVYIFSIRDVAPIIDKVMNDLVCDEEYADDSAGVLDAIAAQHGIIENVGGMAYRFSHLTFQEYYTAKYLADLTTTQVINKILDSHVGEPRWNEVFLIYCGLQKNAESFLEKFKLSIDELRRGYVESIIAYAQNVSKYNHTFPSALATALCLCHLLETGGGRDQVMNIVFLAESIAHKLLKAYKVDMPLDTACIKAAGIGEAAARKAAGKASKEIQRDFDFAAWYEGEQGEGSTEILQRFLVGAHILVSCVVGDVTIGKDFRNQLLAMLFDIGSPKPGNSEDRLIFM